MMGGVEQGTQLPPAPPCYALISITGCYCSQMQNYVREREKAPDVVSFCRLFKLVQFEGICGILVAYQLEG
uniref:Uncharacterized protein n=1 Tax=Anguilla anguilla TaxID=7936 RepID=A0A0E9QZA0_ANGAN